MTSDRAMSALTSFTATVGYHADRTILDVHPPGAAGPVARLVKAGTLRDRAAYELFTGADLREVTGQISPSGALDVDGTPLGIVNLSGGTKADAQIHPMSGARHSYVVANPALWRVVPVGLSPLAGAAADRATRMCFNRMTDLSERVGLNVPTPEYFVALTFEFRAADSAGFRVRRPARKARFEVTVADPRLDRRMVFACLTAMAIHIGWTPRGEAIGMSAPFRP